MKTATSIFTYTERFKTYLAQEPLHGNPIELYEPINYILQLGGKRIRPALLLLANDIAGGNVEDALPAAMAIELFHNFTLIHDDIMDEASIRRNQATVHKKFGNNTAILSGDVMMVWAYEFLQKCPNWEKAFPIFNRTAIEVCEGQQLDLNFEKRESVSIDEYIKMISLKTSVLLACALKVGVLTANGSEQLANQCYSYGKNLGIAFQIHDDILDAYSTNETFGKRIGGDIIHNKKTYLLITALEAATGNIEEQLLHLLKKEENEDAKVQGVLSIYNKLKVKEIAEKGANLYFQKALENVKEMEINDDAKMALRDLAHALMQRST